MRGRVEKPMESIVNGSALPLTTSLSHVFDRVTEFTSQVTTVLAETHECRLGAETGFSSICVVIIAISVMTTRNETACVSMPPFSEHFMI